MRRLLSAAWDVLTHPDATNGRELSDLLSAISITLGTLALCALALIGGNVIGAGLSCIIRSFTNG